MASTTKTSRKGSSETPSRRTATTPSGPSAPAKPPKTKSASSSKPTTAPTASSSKSRKAPAKQLASPPSTGKPAPKQTKSSSPTAKSVASPSAKPQTALPQTVSSPASSTSNPQLTQIAAAQAELAARVLAKRRLIPFTQRINPRYDAGWVHRDIARRLERFSEDVAKGLSPRLMILMPPRHGKACAVGTPVPTPLGFRPIETLRPGDFVFGRDGKPTQVVAVSPVWKDRELFEVTSDDGASVTVDAEHEWTVRLCRKRPAHKAKSTKYLASRSSSRAPALQTYEHAQYRETELPIPPYTLGVWLGDGCSHHATITQGAQDFAEIRAAVESEGVRTSDRATAGTFGLLGVLEPLRAMRLLGDKRIPQSYLTAAPWQRVALLQGLIDTDGHVAPDGQVEFCSTSQALALGTLELVRSLGVKASLIHGRATLDGRDCGPKYRVMFYMEGAARLTRKAARCRDNARTPHRFLTFRPAGRGDTVCIQVAAADHQYLVGHGYLLTHNSELASRMFPAWHLGHHPDHEIIACSYNVSLAMSFSRKVKEVLHDPAYQSVFSTRLHPDFQANEEWGIAGSRGGYVAAGVGGGITGKGAHCLPAKTQVLTPSGSIDIEHLYQLKSKPLVQTPVGPRQVLAMTRREASDDLYVLRFASGKTLRATGKHPIYLPDRGGYATVEEIYGEAQGDGELDLRVVRAGVPAQAVRPREVREPGLDAVLLQQGLQSGAPRDQARQALPDVWQAGDLASQDTQREVLLQGLHPGLASQDARPEDLPGVLRGVSAEVFTDGLLRGDLREYGALDPYDWAGELELPGRQFLQLVVRPGAGAGAPARQGLRDVRRSDRAALPPHRPRPPQQPGGELGDAVQYLPHDAPQVCYDAISVVERVREGAVWVYDLQVEQSGCFFADEVLVGNCLIIDDPIKNAEEADSAETREKLWDWYGSTAYTRLAPGAGVLVIQTWWHDDDLAGKLQTAMSSDPESDQFELVKYPAIAEHDEYLDTQSDLITYVSHNVDPTTYDPYEPLQAHARAAAQKVDLTGLRFLRGKGGALHPQRYDTKKLHAIRKTIPPRFWAALYQQNPVPDDGAYFTKDHFRRAPLPPLRKANVYVAFDFAISEKKQNDYTVGVVGLQDENDVLHVAEVMRFKSGDGMFIVESILNLCQKWYSPNLILGFEDGQIFRAIESLLKKRMRERKFYPSTQLLKPITDKMARARPLQGRMQQGMVSFADGAQWFDAARAEMLRFPAGVHDDQVDALAWMATMVVGREPPRQQQAKAPKSWKDKLNSMGKATSFMGA